LLVAEFGRPTDPDRADNEDYLRENQVEKAKLFFENSAASFYIALESLDVGGSNSLFRVCCQVWVSSFKLEK